MLELGAARVVFTSRADGDMGHAGEWVAVDDVRPNVAARRRAVLDRPWSWVRQVHGADVVRVDRPGGGAGETGDALVSDSDGAVLAILTADCAPVALVGDNGAFGAVHAGWHGLVAGVLAEAVDALRDTGASDIRAALGPCIHPECYEFGTDDLDRVADLLGPTVRGTTRDGRPALDVPAAVKAALDRAGVKLVHDEDVCTACSPDHYSHRARQEKERQAMVVWRE